MARVPRSKVNVEAIAALKPEFEFDDELQETLRQLGKQDPLVGAPLRHRHQGDEIMIEPGCWMDEGWDQQRTGLPPACPVTPLGKDGETCFFLDTMGGVFPLDARSSGKGPIGYLFAGRSRYLEWAWPRWSRGSKTRMPEVIGWEADDARQCLVDACANVGYFALEDQVRGRGAWRDDNDGLIYHAGDAVYIEGAWRPPGVHGRFIYPARTKIGRPSRRAQPAGNDGPGEQLLELLQTFNWDRPEIDPRLMLGWIVTAKVGGALDRRPVGFVPGGEGSGKSTLQMVLRSVMNGALIKTSNTTQAGIYQRLQQDSIAILVDELEAKDDTRTVDKILELARISYSGDTMQRGGKDGVGKEFQLHSSFLGSSISKPATDAQDDSRMFVAMLREREAAGGKIAHSQNELEALGRHLLRRIFDWWPRWAQLLDAFRGALIEAGHNDRACDTFAPLAAGCHLALSDALPTEDELTWWAEHMRPAQLDETAGREKTWQRCLSLMLNAQPDAFRNASCKSVMALLEEFDVSTNFEAGLIEKLGQVGLAISWAEGELEHRFHNCRLFVPSSHPAVHNLLAGTQWAGRLGAVGPWIGVLRQMDRALWFNGKCDKGLDKKRAGIFIHLAQALAA